MGALFAGGRLARRDEGAWPQCPVAEGQRRQAPASKQPVGLAIFGPAAALLVGRRSTRDILPPRVPHAGAKSSATHTFPIYEMGSRDRRAAPSPSPSAAPGDGTNTGPPLA